MTSRPRSHINLICWNANGLTLRKTEFESFLHLHDIDIALVSETHLISYINIPKIRDYQVYLANHPNGSARGGSAIIIKRVLQHYDVGAFATPSIQCSIIAVQLKNQIFNIASVYCPPRYSPDAAVFDDLIQRLGNNFILGGDFNAKHHAWGSRTYSPRGRVLHDITTRHNCIPVSSGDPTYWPKDPNKRPDVLDFYITKGIPTSHLYVQCINDLSSDHVPVQLYVQESPMVQTHEPPLANKTTDWERYRELVNERLILGPCFSSANEIDAAATNFSAVLQTSIQNCTKYSEMLPESISYPLSIQKLVKQRRRARKEW